MHNCICCWIRNRLVSTLVRIGRCSKSFWICTIWTTFVRVAPANQNKDGNHDEDHSQKISTLSSPSFSSFFPFFKTSWSIDFWAAISSIGSATISLTGSSRMSLTTLFSFSRGIGFSTTLASSRRSSSVSSRILLRGGGVLVRSLRFGTPADAVCRTLRRPPDSGTHYFQRCRSRGWFQF